MAGAPQTRLVEGLQGPPVDILVYLPQEMFSAADDSVLDHQGARVGLPNSIAEAMAPSLFVCQRAPFSGLGQNAAKNSLAAQL
jgi:hypothetical protein